MVEIEPDNQPPYHVIAWRNASIEKNILSHIEQDDTIVYISERYVIVDVWFKMKWQIKIGETIISGTLAFFEPEIYRTSEGLEPEFEIEVEDVKGMPMYVRAHFARFEPLS
jgi:hypothetical protein